MAARNFHDAHPLKHFSHSNERHIMPVQEAVLSVRDDAPMLNLGSSKLLHRVRSDQTDNAFSVVEFISEPGEGAGIHVHENEEELVYLLQGQIEVTLGDQTMTVPQGSCAVLPRNIPHGYKNTGDVQSRLLAVLLPGKLDQFFVRLNQELSTDRDHDAVIGELCDQFGLSFIE